MESFTGMIEALLMTRAVRAACLLSLSIGLLFLFVRAPHPWGWNGFDHYHELALALASGQPFPTMEVPWGYAYFLSVFYRLFGDRPWLNIQQRHSRLAIWRCKLAWEKALENRRFPIGGHRGTSLACGPRYVFAYLKYGSTVPVSLIVSGLP